MKKLLIAVVIVSAILIAGVAMASWSGYNYKARIFVGTCLQWCEQKPTDCSYCGAYINDKITMKWNEAWDTCNAGGDCTGAWTNNEWNGMFPGGSGAIWHYKIKWVGPCEEGTFFPDGGYCIWGSYEVLMDQGVDLSMGPGHIWLAHGIPAGYGN
jgi:hypothetical protein